MIWFIVGFFFGIGTVFLIEYLFDWMSVVKFKPSKFPDIKDVQDE